MASLIDIDKLVKNYIASVSGATDTDVVADVAGNILSRPATAGMLQISGMLDLATQTASLSQLLSYVINDTAKANTAAAIGISLREMENILAGLVEGIANVYGESRRPPTPSTGLVTVNVITFPGNADIVIPAGTGFNAIIKDTTRGLKYLATTQVIIPYADRTQYYNASTGKYEAQVPVVSGESGAFTVVDTGAISELLTLISGIDSVYNRTPTFGGLDAESNYDLLQRVISDINGLGVGSVQGYESIVKSIPGVIDAALVGPGHPLMTRDGGLGGCLDIYVITNDVTAASDVFSIA